MVFPAAKKLPPKLAVSKGATVATAAATTNGEPPVAYPQEEVRIYKVGSSIGPITYEMAGQLLGWETEEQYIARMKKTEPNGDFTFGSEYHLLDEDKKKVRCWNNAKNRPFTETHARRLAQDMLKKNWRFNGESIIVGRTGSILSAQHRLIGFRLAVQMWRGKNKERWREYWPTEPVLESVVVYGISEDPATVRTLDNVRPRSDTDVIYTSEIFSDLISSERRECSRMLAASADMLWKRTGASETSAGKVYETHSEMCAFIDRHPKQLECVKRIFTENKERSLSVLKLSPGQCACMLYLMASGKSDMNDYRNNDPRREEGFVTWDLWARACEFWALLSANGVLGTQNDVTPVATAMRELVDSETSLGGRAPERQGILALGWGLFSEMVPGNPLLPEDVDLSKWYYVNSNGVRCLDDTFTFGGIDLGNESPKPEEAADDPTPEELEKAKAEERQKKVDDRKKKAEETKRKLEEAKKKGK